MDITGLDARMFLNYSRTDASNLVKNPFFSAGRGKPSLNEWNEASPVGLYSSPFQPGRNGTAIGVGGKKFEPGHVGRVYQDVPILQPHRQLLFRTWYSVFSPATLVFNVYGKLPDERGFSSITWCPMSLNRRRGIRLSWKRTEWLEFVFREGLPYVEYRIEIMSTCYGNRKRCGGARVTGVEFLVV